MKRIAIAVSLAGAIITGAWAYWLLRPDGAYARYYQGHQVLERLAFGGSGSDELKMAVTLTRAAMKEISITRGLARGLVGGSLLLVGLAVLLAAPLATRLKKPISRYRQ
jgi:hypothetical protein